MGKSFFIKNWNAQLQQDGYKSVYFNAWETDFSESPLLAFMSAVQKQLVQNDDEGQKKLLETTKKGGLYLARKAVPILIKGLTKKLINSDEVEDLIDLSESTDEQIIEAFGEIATDCLKQQEATEEAIHQFKTSLGELVSKITENIEDQNQKKLIIFVDELDRCRPDYAIELLECIKHLFNVEGVVFILAIDEKQLKSTISKKYGLADSGESYLTKFIDWQFNLPEPLSINYSQFLFDDFNLLEINRKIDHFTTVNFFDEGNSFSSGKIIFTSTLGVFCKAYSITLREQAQIFTALNLYIRSINHFFELRAFILGFLPVLLKAEKQLVDQAISKGDAKDLIQRIEELKIHDELSVTLGREWKILKAVITALFLNNDTYKHLGSEFERLDKNIRSPETPRERHERYQFLELVLNHYESINNNMTPQSSLIEQVIESYYKALSYI